MEFLSGLLHTHEWISLGDCNNDAGRSCWAQMRLPSAISTALSWWAWSSPIPHLLGRRAGTAATLKCNQILSRACSNFPHDQPERPGHLLQQQSGNATVRPWNLAMIPHLSSLQVEAGAAAQKSQTNSNVGVLLAISRRFPNLALPGFD
jgi:hypothetical protein